METGLIQELIGYGVAPKRLVSLQRPSPEALDYLDLLPPSADGYLSGLGLLDSVIPGMSGPTLYITDHSVLGPLDVDSQAPQETVKKVLHALACRGETSSLAVFYPGRVDIYPVGFSKQLPMPRQVGRSSEALNPYFADLELRDAVKGQDAPLHKPRRQRVVQQQAVHNLLYNLMTAVTDGLRSVRSLKQDPDTVFALVGRALFARFLVDRKIMTPKSFAILRTGVKPEDCFATAESAAATCKWLDVVFNGDLLPLWDGAYDGKFRELAQESPEALGILTNLISRSPNGQITFEDLWGDLDFLHIPVGLLSEVYEHYAHIAFPEHANRESIHYTPRAVVQYMVGQAVTGVATTRPDKARCLDPAAGAGVFLVMVFRRLIEERWRRTGKQPSRAHIRSILNSQLCGFDINEYALKLAALGLYLTALELDPNPQDAHGLDFKPLFNRILIPVRLPSEPFPYDFPVAGSLGSAVPKRLNGRFDLVIGNAPWTGWTAETEEAKGKDYHEKAKAIVKDLNALARDIAVRVAERRIPRDDQDGRALISKYHNPDSVPDLPFIWRCMEWAKPGGLIALAVHARLLFKKAPAGAMARELLFRCFRVTGIINGGNVTGTRVWPAVTAPFCLLFAQNQAPQWADSFYFISPELDTASNAGRLRVDFHDAVPVQQRLVVSQPLLLKALSRGGPFDAEIMRRVDRLHLPTLGQYWEDKGLACGQGLQFSSKKEDASHLMGKPYLQPDKRRDANVPDFLVKTAELPTFDMPFVHRARDPDIYLAPLVLFREAARRQRERRVLLTDGDCVYSRSFSGYSTHRVEGTEQYRQEMAKYVFVLGVSDFFLYYTLLTSTTFGVNWDTAQKEDFDALPFRPFEDLTPEERTRAVELADAVLRGAVDWERLDRFVIGLYGLDEIDLTVIQDTLKTRLPFKQVEEYAAAAPGPEEVDAFAGDVQKTLAPFFDQTAEVVQVTHIEMASTEWRFLRITTAPTERGVGGMTHNYAPLIQAVGEASGASLVRVIRSDMKELQLGILAQRRYWTPTRARGLALELLQSEEPLFPLPPSAAPEQHARA